MQLAKAVATKGIMTGENRSKTSHKAYNQVKRKRCRNPGGGGAHSRVTQDGSETNNMQTAAQAKEQ